MLQGSQNRYQEAGDGMATRNTGSRNPERDREIHKEYVEKGTSLRELGAKYGISYERVRLIVERGGISPEQKVRIRRMQSDNRKVKWTCEYCKKRKYLPRSEAQQRRFCDRQCWSLAYRTYTDEQLLMALRWLAIQLGHTPGNKDLEGHPGAPSHALYYKRWGSILHAQKAAGLFPNKRGPGCSPITPAFDGKWAYLGRMTLEEAMKEA